MTVFDETKITDGKRFARGEHLLMARTIIRKRYAKHHPKVRILTLAGGSPRGEISAIRELFRGATITAVDKDAECLSAAIDAGVDDVVECDLADFYFEEKDYGGVVRKPNIKFLERPKFEVVVLDFCANAGETLKQIASTYRSLVDDVLIFNFSYGRDVHELFLNESYHEIVDVLKLNGANEAICSRVDYLFTGWQLDHLQSVIVYQGAQMPMCSCLIGGDNKVRRQGSYRENPELIGNGPSFVKYGPGDFELSVTVPEPSLLYACPQERIDSLRRKHAAIKASYTRKKNAEGALGLFGHA